jgi:hypothetical protein
MSLVALGVVVPAAGLGGADAQHAAPPAAPGGPSAHRLAQTCATAFEKNIATGRGFGMPFVADHNGYPGPLHLIELKDRLKSTPDQEAKAQVMMSAMFAESRPKSARLLDAEAKLAQLFANSMRAAVAEVEKAHTEVRLVHLMPHLTARDLLTGRATPEARWSAHRSIGPHGAGSHGAGAPTK